MTDDCSVDLKELAGLISKQTGEEHVRVSPSMRLKPGLSGSGLWLMHVHGDRFRFAVLKVPDPARENTQEDVVSDHEGWKLMKQALWPDDMFPESHDLFSLPLLDGGGDLSVALVSFAGEDRTDPATLSALLIRNFDHAIYCVKALRRRCSEMVERICCIKGTNCGCDTVAACSGHRHMREMTAQALLAKILEFSWSDWGINPESPRHEVGLQVRANPLFFLNTPEAWLQRTLCLPYTNIHGDLNADNVVTLPDGTFVLIDFEKARRGVPYYDVAFLFMWLIKLTRLNTLPTNDGFESHELEDLASRLGQSVVEGPATFDKVGAKDAVLKRVVESVLLSDQDLCPDEVLPREYQRQGLAMAVVMAALARSFYELRNAKKDPGYQSQGKRNGRFYYHLAACVLMDLGLIDVGYIRPKKTEPLETIDGGFCFEIQISSGVSSRPAFLTKLAVEILLDPSRSTEDAPGWNRVVDTDNEFGYFSRLNILTNDRFRDVTRNVLVWRPCAHPHDAELPLLFQLDIKLLRNRLWLNPFPDSNLLLELKSVDLLPLRDGKKAIMGFTFEGCDCTMFQYLRWVSSRNFAEHRLCERRKGSKAMNFLLGGLFEELHHALRAGREPCEEKFGGHGGLHEAMLFQYLLVGHDEAKWSAIEESPIYNTAWEMVRTLYRPKGEDLKYAPEDGPGKWKFTTEEAQGTQYGFSDAAVSAWAHARIDFNRNIKPGVFREANYFQWFIARELAGQQEPVEIMSCFNRGVRREFFKQAWRYVSRHKVGTV